ncbi:unnamed protein product, partial [Rotaria sp. Silwood2]
IEQLYTDRKSEEYSSLILLREEIAKLAEENLTLNPSLNDSLTANVILQSDLQSFKTQLNERQTMLLQYEQRKFIVYGLSLTTIRYATEIESDHSSNPSKQTPTKNPKQHRSLITKQNTDDTNSDDVFLEISLDRTHLKRSSQHRSSRRPVSNARSSTKHTINHSLAITQSPATKHSDDRMVKAVFCGDAAVDKSTLIMHLCKGKFVSNVNSTLGVEFQNKQIEVDGKRVAIQLWDTAGKERFRSIAKSYFRRCDGVILVYDSTYERSFLNIREWINTITDSTLKKVSVMIVANKIDLSDQIRAEGKRIIEQVEGSKSAKGCS